MSRARRAALAAAAACGALALSVGPAVAADPIMPLSEVTPGMVGEARTVVRGTDIVTFPVRIIDVQNAGGGPGGALIIGRAEGPVIDEAGGFIEGMSGSPVYVTGADGVPRVIGAMAYGEGDQANSLAGITPIEQMLDSARGQRALERTRASLLTRRVALLRDRAAARRFEARHADRIGLYPLQRWTVAGVSRPLVGPLSRDLARSGIQLSSVGPRAVRPEVPLVPGATLSVLLAGGDIALGGIGTVTYVDGAKVFGFGHPFLGAGRSRFLLGDGYVLTTVAAPILNSSFKLAEPGALRGMITDDRTDGVSGSIGPVEGIAAVGTATDAARGTTSTVRGTIAPDPRTAPIVGGLVQDEPAARVLDGIEGGTLTLRVSIRSPDLPRPVVYRNVYAAAGDIVTLASGQVPRLLSILLQNGVRPVRVTSLSVEQSLRPGVRAARIVGARVRPRRVRPGQRATLVLALQPWQAARRSVRVPIRIPRGTGPGPVQLRVVPNASGGFDPAPADLTQDLGAATGIGGRRASVVAVERGARRAAGSRIQRLLASLRRANDDRNDAVRLLAPGEAADDGDGRELAVPYVIYGGRATARIVVPRRGRG